MERKTSLFEFFLAAEKDFRIGSTHLAIFAVLQEYRASKGFVNPLAVYRREIAPLAKISSPYTYHKCIRDLSAYGYLKYIPSFKKNRASLIYFFDASKGIDWPKR